jgi:hypothetical protein
MLGGQAWRPGHRLVFPWPDPPFRFYLPAPCLSGRRWSIPRLFLQRPLSPLQGPPRLFLQLCPAPWDQRLYVSLCGLGRVLGPSEGVGEGLRGWHAGSRPSPHRPCFPCSVRLSCPPLRHSQVGVGTRAVGWWGEHDCSRSSLAH